MSVGVRVGDRLGPSSLRVGSGFGVVDPMAGVTQDASALKYAPAGASEWTTAMSVAGIATGNPSSLWLFQEASGTFADSIGARTFSPAGGSPGYQQAVSGWARKATTLAEAGATRIGATVPAATNSFLGLFYIALASTPPAATRTIVEYPTIFAEVIATSRIRADGNNTVDGTIDPGTTVHPIVVKSNTTASAQGVYTDNDKLEPTWFGSALTALTLGSTGAIGAPMSVLYGAIWTGAAAELSSAQIKTLLQTLGWTVAWS